MAGYGQIDANDSKQLAYPALRFPDRPLRETGIFAALFELVERVMGNALRMCSACISQKRVA
jgi:hypothetical protein